MLTWEFPPFISGGLGMACYGLTEALLENGVKVDMMLPSTDDVYFPLKNPNDVNTMPMDFLEPKERKYLEMLNSLERVDRLKRLGISSNPESYLTPNFSLDEYLKFTKGIGVKSILWEENDWNVVFDWGKELFSKVKEYTARAIRYSSLYSCDVIHVHDWLTYPAGVALKRILNKPLVAHIHATEFDRAGGAGDDRIHKIEYRGLTEADIVIAVSRYTAQMIMDRYRVDPKKIRIIHNAHSMTPVSAEKQKLFKDPIILFLGRVTLQKGPDYFLEVAKRVIDRHPNVRFVMAGSGDMFSRILKGSAAKRLKDRFLFTGFLNREQVEYMLSASDIFIMPSVSEPFGIAPLEAMAYGAVAIISKQSGVSEVVNNAFKVDFWDIDRTTEIIMELLDNPKKMHEMAKKGQEEVFAIKWREAANKICKEYGELVCSM